MIIPLITPFKTDDFFPLIEHVLNGGVGDLLLFGTTGEAKYIDLETKKSVIKDVVAHVNDRAKVYVGIITDSLQDAYNLANYCHHTGVVALLFPPVCYGGDFSQVLTGFFKNTCSDIILYGLPGTTPLVIDQIAELLPEKRLLGLKDSAGDFSYLETAVSRLKTDSFKIYCGRESLYYQALKMGIDGIIPASGNVFPDILRSLDLLDNCKKELKSYSLNYIEAIKIALYKRNIISSCHVYS